MSGEPTGTAVPKSAWKWLVLVAITPLAIWAALNAPDTNSASGGTQSIGRSQFETVTLLGDETCSNYVDLDAGPRGDNYFEGPDDAVVHWEDGTSNSITEWVDRKGGLVCFTGPAGERVTVRQVPYGA